MKAMKAIKKMVALGMGLTMVGATIFGASAYTLSGWPAPFVVDGTPATNLAIIVGANAAGSDVVGAVDVIQSLQTSAVKRVASAGGPTQTVIEGDAVEIGSTSDLLEIGESIGNVRETITEVDVDLLRGGQVVTRQGSTEYNQYLRFWDNGAAGDAGNVALVGFIPGATVFEPDERDRVGHYLYFGDQEFLFTWELEFEQGLNSRWIGTTGDLRDLEDEDITILGQPFVIVDTNVPAQDTVNNLTPQANWTVTIDLIGGAISAVLGENDAETYVVDGKEYEVEVLVISETSNNGEGAVKFKINGEITDELGDGDTDVLVDGTQIGIRDILATGKDIQKSIVQFYIGAYKISFEDTATQNDLNAIQAGTKVNEETIEDSNLTISGEFTDVNQREDYRVNFIRYNLFGDAILGDMYIAPGTGVREQLDEPEGMLTPNWDIRYEGLMDTGVSLVRLDAAGNSEYDLEWTNQEGIFYDHPYVSNRNTAPGGSPATTALGSLVYGDRNDDLWFTECAYENGTAAFNIGDDDYFVLSNCLANPYNTPTANLADDTCFTHVMRYDNIDTNNRELTFTDLGTGRRSVVYDNNNNQANVVVGGVTYQATRNVNTPTATVNQLAIDLNGDGAVNVNVSRSGLGKALVAVQGEGLINLGWQCCMNLTNVTSDRAWPIAAWSTSPDTDGLPNCNGTRQNWANLTLITLAKEFDEAISDEVLYTNVSGRANQNIGIAGNGVVGSLGYLYGLFELEENEDLEQGLSGYGVFVEWYNPSGIDKAEDLTYEYPLSQRGSRVFVTGGSVTTSEVSAGGFEQMQPIQIGAAGTDLEYANTYQNYNAIVVGGPCANSVTAAILGNPDPCWESVGENKAVIKLFEHANGNVALLINGRSALNTRQGCRAVATGQIASVEGKEAEVTGTTLTDITVKAV